VPEQNYAKHAKSVTLYHRVLFGIAALTLIGSVVNLIQSLGDHSRLYNASLILALTIALILAGFFARFFPLQAQDRTIRAEENLRHYVLTGKLLDPRLTLKQIVGLRFASDTEFVGLAQKAAEEGMSQDAIKRAIQNWKPDHDRL
jgi:hypothetical protein